MTTKAELVEQARAAGIDVDPGATKAELEEAIAKLDANETRPAAEGTTAPRVADDHQHVPGPTHEGTTAGAHRHGPADEPHDHPAPVSSPADDVVTPPPAGEHEPDSGEAPPLKTWTVERDCRVVVNGQLLDLKAGEPMSGETGQYLADTGAPVKLAK